MTALVLTKGQNVVCISRVFVGRGSYHRGLRYSADDVIYVANEPSACAYEVTELQSASCLTACLISIACEIKIGLTAEAASGDA